MPRLTNGSDMLAVRIFGGMNVATFADTADSKEQVQRGEGRIPAQTNQRADGLVLRHCSTVEDSLNHQVGMICSLIHNLNFQQYYASMSYDNGCLDEPS